MLKDKDGTHSYQKCMELLAKAKNRGEISGDEFFKCEQRLQWPGALGFDQYEIDQFYKLIKYWYSNPKDFKFYNLNDDILNGVIFSKNSERLSESIFIPSKEKFN
ncbi:hypothetical protein KEH51_05265 [[Brevibacterium] frigoritolerans]|uniref:Uncharacterized protein n=1 Tax=Peribacillus frigoritolerans TaxID=450367 RepID=A0A941FQD9_9BACI|nr:hypothetical protein [Peribacillus frigoritolerans]